MKASMKPPKVVRDGRLTQNQYKALHDWVRRHRGTPSLCEVCGTTTAKTYHWANLSQEYKRDLSDWRRLCPTCHMRENNPGCCNLGHELTESNTYYYPAGSPHEGSKECRICRQERRRVKLAAKTEALKRKAVLDWLEEYGIYAERASYVPPDFGFITNWPIVQEPCYIVPAILLASPNQQEVNHND